MKRVLVLCLILLSPMVSAASDPQENLLRMLSDQQLVVSSDPEVIILGGVDVALSQGPWSEEAVLAFSQTYGYRPTVLPLTYVLSSSGVKGNKARDDEPSALEAANFYRTDPQTAYYLYVNLPDNGALRDKLTSGLQTLLEDAFQRRLAEGGFAVLSPTYQGLWQVRLGMQPPRFQNGYL